MADEYDDDQEGAEEEAVSVEAGAEKPRTPSETWDVDDPFDVMQFNLDMIKTVQTFDTSVYADFLEDQIKLITDAVKVIRAVQEGLYKKYKGKIL